MNRVWLFDLDNTLHDASAASMAGINEGMTTYIERELGLERDAAQALRRLYWQRYGATLLGLVRHHGVDAAHFLHHTHLLPGLEARVRGQVHDAAALHRLRGRKVILTNAPRAYALRVLKVLGLSRFFEAVFSIEDMAMFGRLRPKPTRACCGAWQHGCARRRGAVCWSRTRWVTRRRRVRSACGRSGCNVGSGVTKLVFTCTEGPPTCVPESAR
jgi:pyrimidine 5'-nucleotidase